LVAKSTRRMALETTMPGRDGRLRVVFVRKRVPKAPVIDARRPISPLGDLAQLLPSRPPEPSPQYRQQHQNFVYEPLPVHATSLTYSSYLRKSYEG
jgi:hypothetical protein